MLAGQKPKLLLSSRSKEMAQTLEDLVIASALPVSVEARVTSNGHTDPLHSTTEKPDILLLHLSEHGEDELRSLIDLPRQQRPALIVVANPRKIGAMRLAMQAGARDYLLEPLSVDELTNALERIVTETVREAPAPTGANSSVTVFMNAKGGSGSTFIASNVAHLMTKMSKTRVALLDLDLQFGSLPLYLDLKLKHGIARALEGAEDLDPTALSAYMTTHESGLRVLGNTPGHVLLPREVPSESILQLLNVLQATHEHVIVDLPRRIDHFSATVLERADRIALVVQQNVSSLRDAGRMLEILKDELALTKDRVVIVLNRYNKSGEIEIGDIKKSLGPLRMFTIPNQYKAVSESINLGIPIHNLAPNSMVCKALSHLETQLTGRAVKSGDNILSRTWAQLRRTQ